MKRVPPSILEAIIALLLPPARREEMLGDLQERYVSGPRYLAEALQIISATIRSQIRRTTDPQLLMIEASGLFVCFLSAALWAEPAWVWEPGSLWQVLIPVTAMESVFLVANAYAPPRARHLSLLNGALAIAFTLTVEAVLAASAFHSLVLPAGILYGGCAASAFLLSASRLLTAPERKLPPSMTSSGETDMYTPHPALRLRALRRELRRSSVSLAGAALVPAGMGAFTAFSAHAIDRILAGLMVMLTLYLWDQLYRRWPATAVPEPVLKAQLEQWCDHLRHISTWYVGPFLGALLLFALRLPLTHWDEPSLWTRVLPFAILAVVWSVTMVKKSEHAARKLQTEIDQFGGFSREE